MGVAWKLSGFLEERRATRLADATTLTSTSAAASPMFARKKRARTKIKTGTFGRAVAAAAAMAWWWVRTAPRSHLTRRPFTTRCLSGWRMLMRMSRMLLPALLPLLGLILLFVTNED